MTSLGNATETLRRDIGGRVITAEDLDYDEARSIFNSMIDRRPRLIVQCESGTDVASAIRVGRNAGLEIAVRGGGHGVAGRSLVDDGMVIDLKHMNQVSVDPGRKIARVGGGATIGHLDRATEPFRLATTGGRVSTTGVGGFVLGGGGGWLDRKFGLACDNLLQVELVTADGEAIVASDSENPDLFWALHGGGGNFGVATAFTLRLHDLAVMSAALLLWDPESGPEVARAYRDFLEAAPDEIGGGLIYLTAPADDFVPADMVDRLACAVLITYVGPLEDGRAEMAPMLGLGHRAELFVELPYAELNSMLDDPPGYRNYWSAEYLGAFPDDAVDLFCRRADDMIVPSPSQHVLFPQGGAVARGPADYPISWRDAPWIVHPFGLWTDPADDERARQWARDIRSDLAPWASGDVYLNFIGDEGHDRVVAGFGEANYRRLAEVKAAYDPDNVFHLNHNVLPA